MKVLRKQELETTVIQEGDQIIVQLTGFGEFIATAQKTTDKGTLFLFDDCVAERSMNKKNTNKGGYEESDLCEWINTVLLNAFPEDIKTRIGNIAIPTYGQLFGHDDFYYMHLESDEDTLFPLMQNRRDRIVYFKNDYRWYWMQNATKNELSAAYFAVVYGRGYASYSGAADSLGVRPVFLLI